VEGIETWLGGAKPCALLLEFMSSALPQGVNYFRSSCLPPCILNRLGDPTGDHITEIGRKSHSVTESGTLTSKCV